MQMSCFEKNFPQSELMTTLKRYEALLRNIFQVCKLIVL